MKHTRAALVAGTVVAVGVAMTPASGSAAATPTVSLTSKHSGNQGFGPAQRAAALQQARTRADAVRRSLGLPSNQGLQVKDVIRDADGTTHVRYNRTYRGLPVVGGDLVVHSSPAGAIESTDWAHRGPVAVGSLTPQRSADSAAHTAARSQGGRAAGSSRAIWAVHTKPTLAWQTRVRGTDSDGTPIDELVYTDAATGKVLGSQPFVYTADGTGHSLYSGTVSLQTTLSGSTYQLYDQTRGGHKTYNLNGGTSGTGTLFTDSDNVWGNGSTSSTQSAAVDAAYGAAETWDFYKNVLGRTGIKNNGVGAYSRVHYSTNYDNAFWDDSCFCMTYGDGSSLKPLVSLDVAGHEMTHGVTSNTAGLVYSGESGGLNESTSDVFGTMVEFYANNASDPGDYYIGEKIVKTGTSLRRMDNPSSDGSSANCWYSGVGNLDVHYSSGVGNHLFYLLSEGTGTKTIGGLTHTGTSCNGTTFSGIGRDAAAKIWYRALTTYMTSTTTYKTARDAMIRAATDLYGASSAQCAGVQTAWSAVSVPAQSASCGTTPPPSGSNVVVNGGFESGAASWTGDTGSISNWSGPHSGSYYAWLLGYGTTHTEQVSQTVTIPAGKTAATLAFYTNITTQETGTTAYDTLKVQAVSGGVTTTLATYSNVSKTSGWVAKSLNMSSYVGKTVTIKFLGNEDSSLATDFKIDDVALNVS